MPRVLTIIIASGPQKGQVFEINDDQPRDLGRRSRNLPISDSRMSRQHARLVPERGMWYIEDLKSRNGTYVNGEAIIGRTLLNDGDRVQVGRTYFVVTTRIEKAPESPRPVERTDVREQTPTPRQVDPRETPSSRSTSVDNRHPAATVQPTVGRDHDEHDDEDESHSTHPGVPNDQTVPAGHDTLAQARSRSLIDFIMPRDNEAPPRFIEDSGERIELDPEPEPLPEPDDVFEPDPEPQPEIKPTPAPPVTVPPVPMQPPVATTQAPVGFVTTRPVTHQAPVSEAPGSGHSPDHQHNITIDTDHPAPPVENHTPPVKESTPSESSEKGDGFFADFLSNTAVTLADHASDAPVVSGTPMEYRELTDPTEITSNTASRVNAPETKAEVPVTPQSPESQPPESHPPESHPPESQPPAVVVDSDVAGGDLNDTAKHATPATSPRSHVEPKFTAAIPTQPPDNKHAPTVEPVADTVADDEPDEPIDDDLDSLMAGLELDDIEMDDEDESLPIVELLDDEAPSGPTKQTKPTEPTVAPSPSVQSQQPQTSLESPHSQHSAPVSATFAPHAPPSDHAPIAPGFEVVRKDSDLTHLSDDAVAIVRLSELPPPLRDYLMGKTPRLRANPWPWIVTVVVLLVSLGVNGYFFYAYTQSLKNLASHSVGEATWPTNAGPVDKTHTEQHNIPESTPSDQPSTPASQQKLTPNAPTTPDINKAIEQVLETSEEPASSVDRSDGAENQNPSASDR